MRFYVGVAVVVICFLFVEGQTFSRRDDTIDPGNATVPMPMNCMFRILLRQFYDRFPIGPIEATIQADPHRMYGLVGKAFRFYKVIGDKHLAMEEMGRKFTGLVWRSHASCAPVRFHQIISNIASQSLQRNAAVRNKIKEALATLAFGFEKEFASEVLKEMDSLVLVPYRRFSDALFMDLQQAIWMVLQKTEMIIDGTQWRTDTTKMFDDVDKAFPSVKRCISFDEVVQVHRQFIGLITQIVNGDLQKFLDKIKEMTKQELKEITSMDPTPVVDRIASILKQHIKDFIKHVAEYENAVAARNFPKIRSMLTMILPAHEALYVDRVITLLEKPIPGTGNCSTPTVAPVRKGRLRPTPTVAPVRKGRPRPTPTVAPVRKGRPRPTPTVAPVRKGRPRPTPTVAPVRKGRPRPTGSSKFRTGEPKAPATTESVMERVLDQLKQHERNLVMENSYEEQNDQENELYMNFDDRKLGRPTPTSRSIADRRGRPTGIPRIPHPTGGPHFPEDDDGKEALKEFIWNLTTVFPSGPMSDAFNLPQDEIVEKIKTAFKQYPAMAAKEILKKLYLDLGITILTEKSKCPASKFAHVMIYMLRMEMEEDSKDEDDSLKSKLVKILSTTNLKDPTPDEYAEYMVHGLHHSMFRQMIFETARSLTKDTHRTLIFLRKKLFPRVSKPFDKAKIAVIVKEAVRKFPKVGRCVTARELVDWHKHQKTEFDQIKKDMNITAVMEFLRIILTSSLKNLTGNDYPTQVQSMLVVFKSYIDDVMDLAENFYKHVIAQDMNKMVELFDDLDDKQKTYFKEILKKLGFTSTGQTTDDDKRGQYMDDQYRSLNSEENPFNRYYRKLFV